MSVWNWEGVDKDGKKMHGSIEAQNEREFRRILRAKGVRPTKIKAPSVFEIDIGQWLVEKGFARPFTAQDLLMFTKQLSVMINAGVPILQALEILFKQQRNPVLKLSVKKIATAVGGGKSLSEAMSVEKGFDRLYCNLVKAGEAGGVLDTILVKLSEYLEKNEKIKQQIKSAMTYPTIVIIVGAAVIYVMLVFVVPKFTEMLTESGQEIPAITQMVIDASAWMQEWTPYIVPGVFVGTAIFVKWIKSDIGKPIWDAISMRFPIFGAIIIKGNLTSFSRTLATMLSSGVSLIDSLQICADTIDNLVIAKDVRKIKKGVEEGKTLTEPLGKINYFPEMVSQMIKVGEQTGNMDQMLLKVAEVFEREVEELIGTMTKLIEPIILVFLGGIVAVLLVAMYLPIFMSAGGV